MKEEKSLPVKVQCVKEVGASEKDSGALAKVHTPIGIGLVWHVLKVLYSEFDSEKKRELFVGDYQVNRLKMGKSSTEVLKGIQGKKEELKSLGAKEQLRK